MQALRTLIEAPELHTGLVAGGVTLVLGALIVTAWRIRGAGNHPLLGIIGPAGVVATLVALTGPGAFDEVVPVPVRVVVALAVLWIAGEIGSRTTAPVGTALAFVGGVVLVGSSGPSPAWITVVLVLVPAFAGAAVADFDRRASRSGLGALLLVISIFGLYTTVPETELVLVLLGAMVPVTFLAWPCVLARLGAGGAYAAVGLFVWIAAVDGAGRPGSIVGGIATLALLVAEPIGHLLAVQRSSERADRAPNRVRSGVVGFVVVQLLLTAYAARVAGRADDPMVALILALPAVVIGVAFGARARLDAPEIPVRPLREAPGG